MTSELYLIDDRYLAALYRQRDRIATGEPFVAADSDVTGDKWTHASWGLCSRDREAWPDREDHMWPDQFDEGRVAPKYRKQHQPCPMQKKNGPNGCFYSCRIFTTRDITKNKRVEAVHLYDAAIEKARARAAIAASGV